MKYLPIPYVVLATVSTPASAIVESFVSVNPPEYSYQSGALSVQDQLTVGSSTAYAYGDLFRGVLRVQSSSGPLESGYSGVHFNEYVTFNAGANGIGYLDWAFSAKVSPGIIGNTPLGPAQVGLHMQVDSIVEDHSLTNGFCFLSSCTSARGGTTTFTKSGSIAFNISPDPIYFAASLYGSATGTSNYFGLGAWMDASNTGRFFLRLPDGVSYTSPSGGFLVNASPVPELNSWMLLLSGMLLLLQFQRRRAVSL